MRQGLSPRLFPLLTHETLGENNHEPSSSAVSTGCSRIKSFAFTGFQGWIGESSPGPPAASQNKY